MANTGNTGNVKFFTNLDYDVTTFTAQGATLTYSTGGSASNNVPLLIMQIDLSYSRRLNKMYPINHVSGKAAQINVLGAPQGQLTIQNIFSPNHADMVKFFQTMGAVCKKGTKFVLNPFGASCKDTDKLTDFSAYSLQLNGVELETFQLNIQGGEAAMVQQPLQFSFTTMEFTPKQK